MYTENIVKDTLLFTKAALSNQIAAFFPKLYVKITHQTGRGNEQENANSVAEYFMKCFHDYRKFISLGTKSNLNRPG